MYSKSCVTHIESRQLRTHKQIKIVASFGKNINVNVFVTGHCSYREYEYKAAYAYACAIGNISHHEYLD